MRIVIQRVDWASVEVDAKVVGKIDIGLLIFLGVHHDDTEAEADFLVDKSLNLRIFSDDEGKMNKSLLDVGGNALIISQFTLYGDCKKGRRPSYTEAARPEKGEALYEYFVSQTRKILPNVQTGIFGAHMDIQLHNDGPVTMLLEK